MYGYRGYRARHGGAYMGRIAGLGLSPRRPPCDLAAIRDPNGARLAVELEEYGARAVLMRIAGGHVTHDQGLAALEIDVDFLSGVHPVKVHRGGQRAHIAERAAIGRIVGKYLGVHQM